MVAQGLDEKVHEFLERRIDSYVPFLFVDASYFKMRDGVRYISKALLIVVGVRPDGYRDIFTFSVADAEHELTWDGIFSDLKEWRLNKVDLIISDSQNGIQIAAGKMFSRVFLENMSCTLHLCRPQEITSEIPQGNYRDTKRMSE